MIHGKRTNITVMIDASRSDPIEEAEAVRDEEEWMKLAQLQELQSLLTIN